MRSRLPATFLTLSALALVLAFGIPAFAQDPAATASVYRYSHWRPAAIFCDNVDSTTLEVVTTGSGISYIEVGWSWGLPPRPPARLYDDGTHGDRVAGDGIYTVNGLTYPDLGYYWLEGKHCLAWTGGTIYKLDGTTETFDTGSLGLVSPGQRLAWADFGHGLSATRSAFFIVDSAGEIFPNMPLTDIYCGKPLPAATRKLYSVFPDVFDFVIVEPNGSIYLPGNYGENVPYFLMAKNDVQHIGVPIFNETATWGSAGRLRGMIYHSFGVGSILDHEIGHAWGMRLGYSLGLLQEVDPGGRYGHWLGEADVNGQMSYAFMHGSVMGILVSNGDGTWRLENEDKETSRPYSPLELYAMGLIPSQDVPPVHILVNPDYSNPQRITASQVRTITIQQIVAAEGGERVPSWQNSQKYFNAAMIVVSDRPFTGAERAFYTLDAEFFASAMRGHMYDTPFYSATGGRAFLSVRLPVQGFHDVYLPVNRRGS